MKIQREILLNAIKRIMPGIGKDKTALQGMDTIIINEGGLHTFNGVICATVPMQTDGITGAVKGDKFFKLVQKLKGEEVSIEALETGLRIECGRNKSTLSWVQDVKTPEFISELHNVQPAVKLPDNFQEALSLCDISTNARAYAGTFFRGDLVMSTDLISSNIYNFKEPIVDEEDKDAQFWISVQNATQLLKLDDTFTHYTTRHVRNDGTAENGIWIHFRTTEGTIFSCTLLKFPEEGEEIHDILGYIEGFNSFKKEGNEMAAVLPDGFKEAVERVGALSSKSEDMALDYVQLTFTKNHLAISSKSSAGSSEEELPWNESTEVTIDETFKASYLYPVSFLVEVYGKARNFWLKDMTGGGDSPITTLIFHSGNYKHLVTNIQDPAE